MASRCATRVSSEHLALFCIAIGLEISGQFGCEIDLERRNIDMRRSKVALSFPFISRMESVEACFLDVSFRVMKVDSMVWMAVEGIS